MVERTLAWLARFRRLRVRDERLAAMHLAFLQLDESRFVSVAHKNKHGQDYPAESYKH